MAEERGADGTRDKADRVDPERLQCPDQRVGSREIQIREDERGHLHVEEEIVSLDRGSDRARDDGAAELPAVLGIGKGARGEYRLWSSNFLPLAIAVDA